MSKVEGDEQLDADILQSKADVLRARDIIPPYDKKPRQPEKRQEKNTEAAVPAEIVEIPDKKDKTPRAGTSKLEKVERGGASEKRDLGACDTVAEKDAAPTAQNHDEKIEIPRFNLAKELLARQREVASTRRKGPGSTPAPRSRQPEPKPKHEPIIEPESEPRPARPVRQTHEPPGPGGPGRERIIAEIVARDIERLRRNNNH